MAKLFKLNALNSDGSDVPTDKTIDFEVIDPSTSKPFVDDNGKPSVVITLRPITQSKYRSVMGDNTQRLLNKKTRQMEEVTDWDQVQDDLVEYSIQSWTGLIGADDKPLQCVLDAKLGLPGELKNELVQRAMQGEAVSSESFRSAS